MSFGAQWLNDWESEREERLPVPVAHFKTTQPPEPIPPLPFNIARVVREIVASELGGILAPAWASSLTDRIVSKILTASEQAKSTR